jgi:alpha-galactosidase
MPYPHFRLSGHTHDEPETRTLLHGVVADRSSALRSRVRLGTSPAITSGRVPLPGLDPDRRYRLRPRTEIGRPELNEHPPGWLPAAEQDSLILGGRTLSGLGLPMPTLQPQQALLLQLDAI